MLRCILFTLFSCLLTVGNAGAAGFVHNANFVIFTPTESSGADQDFAQQVLDRAEEFRREIATQWLGSPLPDGAGRTIISVKLSEARTAGLTWVKDTPRRSFQNVFLNTTRSGALGGTLKHEMTHVVLGTRFPHPDGLPIWIEEGIASRYDDDESIAARQRIASRMVSTGQRPDLRRLFASSQIHGDDGDSYAAAGSVVEFLLARDDRNTLFQFAQAGKKQGWDAAVRQCYGMQNVDELATAWQQWARQSSSGKAAQP